MEQKDAFNGLLDAWRASGGTLLELIEELGTERGRELAEVYGISGEEVTRLLELSAQADEILARLTKPKPSSEPHGAWVRRMARALFRGKWDDPTPGQDGGDGGDAELGSAAGPSNSERFPKALRAWLKAEGLAEDFDTLTPAQLVQVGVPQAELAAELALNVWLEGGGTREDFAELSSEQRAEMMALFT